MVRLVLLLPSSTKCVVSMHFKNIVKFCIGHALDGYVTMSYYLEESVLRDLKALLIEAKQKVPPFLHQLDSLTTDMLGVGDDKGCAYCGGLGHRITECPKLAAIQQQEAGKIGRRDFIADSAADY